MSVLPIYPDARVLPGLEFGTSWEPSFFNMPTQVMATGAEIDLSLSQYPLHTFKLSYELLRDMGRNTPTSIEFKTLMGFWLQLSGTQGRFAFANVADRSVAQQLVGTGDGTTLAFTLVRTFGAGGYSGTEPVGVVDVNASPFNVYLGESATPVDPSLYTLSTITPLLQTVTFLTPPLLGSQVRVDMSYFYYCKFPSNTMSFGNFMKRLWEARKVEIHSCRVNA